MIAATCVLAALLGGCEDKGPNAPPAPSSGDMGTRTLGVSSGMPGAAGMSSGGSEGIPLTDGSLGDSSVPMSSVLPDASTIDLLPPELPGMPKPDGGRS